jgi:hypothetical protein
MEIPGHSQIALPMNTDSHLAPGASREAADRIAQVLWQNDAEDQADNEDRAREDATDAVQPQREMQLGPATSARKTGKSPGQYGCAARDSNPEPAD